ncbi:MAG: hypothetical protein CM15mP47_5200 [Methanobacteriota archaeon]|nr:MAG: hypothetical protein CM15mP47_5200 [Euryarchaeota archaeon]
MKTIQQLEWPAYTCQRGERNEAIKSIETEIGFSDRVQGYPSDKEDYDAVRKMISRKTP